MYIENNNFIIDEPIKHGVKYILKYCILSWYDVFFRILLTLCVPKQIKRKYKLACCSIFKNEAPFLREFIEYHHMLGVEHFYLYNNNSTDDYDRILKPYIEAGIVTLIEWPISPGQFPMYKDWYEKYRIECNWCTFLDLDEFICPLKNDSIIEWIDEHSKYPVLQIYWQMFGTSGRMKHDYSKLVIEQYKNAWDKLDTKGKVIYNTAFDIDLFFRAMMHGFRVKYLGFKIPPINIYGKFVWWNIDRYNNKERSIQVNHYWSKAYECWESKYKKGSAVSGVMWKNYDKFLWHEHFNRSTDVSIQRFLIELKLKLQEYEKCLS